MALQAAGRFWAVDPGLRFDGVETLAWAISPLTLRAREDDDSHIRESLIMDVRAFLLPKTIIIKLLHTVRVFRS